MELLTTSESKILYLVNKKVGRIYGIGKETGKIEKVIKINNTSLIIDSSIDSGENVYVLTGDNKVWKIPLR
jgi:hypothetical protein